MRNLFIDVGGVATRCLVAGDPAKPNLFLLHGLTLTADVWSRNLDALGAHFNVVAPDLLGHGFTQPRDSRPPGIEEKLDHLLDLANALGFERFALDGSSYGALIAANLALRVPEHVSRLVITGSGSCFNSEADLATFMTRLWETYSRDLTTMSPNQWRQRLSGTVFDLTSVPPELPAILSLAYGQPWLRPCWERAIGDLRQPDVFRPFRILDRLEELALPTLVVWGRQDRGGIYESAVAAAARMPQGRLIAFDHCAHVPMLEQAAPYNRAVEDFLLE